MPTRLLSVAALLIALSWPAAGGADPIVLHSFVGDRPASANYLLGPFTKELADRGHVTGSKLGSAIEQRLSKAGRELTAAEVTEVRRQVDQGWEEWTAGNFDATIALMEPALATLVDAPASLANDQTLRRPLRRALVTLGLVYSRKGDPSQAEAYLAEVVRSFPDMGIDRGTFGPDAKKLHARVKANLESQGKGVLRIEVDNPSAGIFLNGRFLAIGRSRQESLLPGRYRVFVRVGDGAGRVHEVDIAAGGTQTVNVLSGLDAVLRTRDFVGFEFASEEQRQEREANYATAVARAVDAGPIVVVGLYEGPQGKVLRGTLYTPDGSVLLKGDVAAEPVAPAPQVARNLARWLTGEDKAAEVIVRVGDGAQPADQPTDDDEQGSSLRPIAMWTTGILGVAAAGTGVTLLVLDGSCSSDEPSTGECAEVYDTSTTGLIAAGAGAALLTTAVVLFAVGGDDEAPPERAAGLVPLGDGGWMMAVSGRF